MIHGQRVEDPPASWGQDDAHEAVVRGVAAAGDDAPRLGPIDELDGAVMTKQEVGGELADGRVIRPGMAPDGEQQLVLRGGQPGGLGPLGAPPQETAQVGADLEEPAVVLVAGLPSAHPENIS